MSTREANSTGRETRPARDQGRSAAEWVTLSVSIAIIAVLVGLVITVYLFGGDEPATIEVRPLLEEVRHADGAAYLPVEVTNNGDRTAEDVYVQMTLHTDEVGPVTTSFTIRFLAGGEQQRGVVAFNQNPAEGELRWTLSFIEP